MCEEDQVELGVLLRLSINNLAALFYQSNGRIYDPDINFSGSSHPEEVGCWNKALVAYAHIQEDDWYLQFQVGL